MRLVLAWVAAISLLAAGCQELAPYSKVANDQGEPAQDAQLDASITQEGTWLDARPADVVADDAARPDATVDTLVPDTTADALVPDTTTDALTPDTTADALTPDTTADTLAPDTTADTLAPDATADTLAPDSTVDTQIPDSTVDTQIPDSTLDGPPTVSISGSVAVSNGISCGSTEANDCRGRLFVGAYSARLPPFEPSNLIAYWESPGVVDLTSGSADYTIQGLPPNATYYIWPFLAEDPTVYVNSNPANDDLTPFSGPSTTVGDQDTTRSTIELSNRWFGG